MIIVIFAVMKYAANYQNILVKLLLGAFLLGSTTVSLDAQRKRRKKATRKARQTITATQAPEAVQSDSIAAAVVADPIQTVIATGEKLLGRRYRTTGVAPWALDCSGYVRYIYGTIGIQLPASSAAQSLMVSRVSDPQPGDLIFFKGHNIRRSRVGHVAMVVENNDGDLVIMHSTNSQGIIKHRLATSQFFRSRVLFAGRIPALKNVIEEKMISRPLQLTPPYPTLLVVPPVTPIWSDLVQPLEPDNQ